MTAILLAALAFSHLAKFYAGYSALIVAAVAAYAALELGAWRMSDKNRNLARYALVTLVVFLIVVAPTLLEIFLRRATAPYEHIHDGALQTEAAMQFLLAGKTPFGQNYAETTMGRWIHYVIPPEYNPTLRHYFYLPITFLLPLPFYFAMQALVGWFDIRVVSLAAFLALWFLLPLFTPNWESKLALLITIGLNPLTVPPFVEGRNDILVLLFLALSFFALQRGRLTGSAIFFGVACATKATAWFIAPLYFTHIGFVQRDKPSRLVRPFASFALTCVFFVLPFALWDFRAFWGDLFAIGAETYDIGGYGVSMILHALDILPERLTMFPFWILQLAFGLPVLVFLLRYQSRERSARALVIASSVFVFVLFFFSRKLADNYLGYALALGLLGYFIPADS